ncbi:hypothetical protein OAO39_03265 [Pirellulaceae bacterium]|jgi:hypothetical protein|nr:hypothetical protein [Pirellulaceae bacterium]
MPDENLGLPGIVPPQSDVPVFNCVVHVTIDGEGQVFAKTANLAGIECHGNSQLNVLSKIVPLFKERVGALHRSGEPIPWIDVEAPTDDTQVLLVPVHL